MELLRLCLSPINEVNFKVSAYSSAGEGENESTLPFFEDDIDWLNSLIKTLDASDFDSIQFQQDGEQDWMIGAGLLTEERSAFHPNLQANIGQKLYHTLFPTGSEVEKLLERAITLAEMSNSQLHIQFQFHANPVQRSRLSDYPWELVHDGHKFLAHHRVTFSRYIAHRSTPPNILPVEKINVLLVSSTAFDLENKLKPLPQEEQQAICKGIEKAQRKKRICFVKLKKATFNNLRAYLTENRGGKTPHVLHFDGHGVYGKQCRSDKCRTIHKGIKVNKCRRCGASLSSPQGYLMFEDDEGKPDYVSARKLGDLIQQSNFGDDTGQQQGIVLAVLSACKSGMALASDSDFNGIAQNLISRQVPAVVAMHYLVNVQSATAFAEQFYRSLGQRNSLATAVNHGREAIGFESNQWYRPVLYLRWKSNEGGQLFARSQAPTSHKKIERVLQEVSNQLTCVSSVQLSEEIRNANDKLKNRIKQVHSLKLAERWLEDENSRLKLASTVAKIALKGKSLNIYPTQQAKKEFRVQFEVNLYYCLTWLFEAFQGCGIAKETYILKEYLTQYPPLEFYPIALRILKDKVEKELDGNRDLIDVIHHYIELLIESI